MPCTRRASCSRASASWRRRSRRTRPSPCRPPVPCCPRTARRECAPRPSADAPTSRATNRIPEASMPDLYNLGERPPLGVVPSQMHAYAVRQSRFGPPRDAWKREVLPTPAIGPDEVLIYVMASGINFNNVWAALGTPVDVIGERQKTGEPEDFHAGGSDCSGIVWAVGKDVRNVAVGDEVIVHSGWWRPDDPWVLAGKDPMLAESTRIWGYQTNYGSYCQFARAQGHQCVPKPARLTWEEAGCFLLCASTAYRMLTGWPPNIVEPGDVVLVWGAAGGLGSLALDIV